MTDNNIQDKIKQYLKDAIAAERSFEMRLRRHAVRADDMLLWQLLTHDREETRGTGHMLVQ